MALFDFFKPKVPLPEPGEGVLPILFRADSVMNDQLEEDLAVYGSTGQEVLPLKTDSTSELTQAIENRRPQLIHLLAKFSDNGSLVDSNGAELSLGDLMRVSEESGCRLFIIASENPFEYLTDHIPEMKIMNFLTIMTRNQHFTTFLSGIISGLSTDPNFAMVYVKLAPQFTAAQEGRPLPGSIAICPGKSGKLVLWSEAQP